MRAIAKTIQSGKTFLILLIAGLVLLALATFYAQADESACPNIPDISWWNITTNEKLTAYVDAKHGGDWEPYIQDWQRYEERMREVMFRGGSAIVKSSGNTLSGKELAQYVRLINARIMATRCIADKVIDARLIEELNNMNTAAGGNPEMDIQLVE
ncbi:MAG: hypothetical protein ISR45_07915 [Rhodospirillales bacterium]|nr:hypothetical protein [Rhodospirillales bacterium]